VIVEESRIAKLVPSGSELPPGAKVVDGAGGTLLPGLVDAHTHLLSTAAPTWYLALPDPGHNLEAYLYAGVTTIASMGDDLREIAPLRARVEHGELLGPRILYAGSPITRTGGHPEASKQAIVPFLLRPLTPDFSAQIDTTDDAKAAVTRAADGGASFVKLGVDDLPGGMPRLEHAHIAAAVAAAHARGLKVAAHVGTAKDALLAVAGGVDLLNHAPNRGPLSDADAQAIAKAGVPVVPTMIVFERVAQLGDGHLELGPMHRAIESPEILEELTDAKLKANGPPAFLRAWTSEIVASRRERAACVLALYRAGARMLVGTDSAILGNIAGASIHDEMRMLFESGVPAADILLGATSRSAAFFFERPEFGTIEPGKIADLLLVEGNPLDDIRATERIRLVVRAGRVVRRE
jgi:imidazolonepropionase-like amidohydrolase